MCDASWGTPVAPRCGLYRDEVVYKRSASVSVLTIESVEVEPPRDCYISVGDEVNSMAGRFVERASYHHLTSELRGVSCTRQTKNPTSRYVLSVSIAAVLVMSAG